MLRACGAVAIVMAAMLAISPAVRAETRVALVIGNSAYRNTPALPNPRNDAAAVAAALPPLGFSVLTGFDLDRTGTESILREFGRALEGSDVALFYYAGHGLQVDLKNYIVPVDARLASENDLPFEAVDLTLVLSLMERRPRTNLVFLDACRDNPLAQNLARSMGAARSTAVARGLAIAESGIGTLLVYATQPGNIALDGTGAHSPFTQGLLDYIATPDIEVRQMLSRVRSSVLAATDGKQVPWDHSSLTGDFFFAARGLAIAHPDGGPPPPAAPAQPTTADREALFWDSIKGSADPADFHAYLDQYPKGTFAALARNRLAALNPQQATAAGTAATQPTTGPTAEPAVRGDLGLTVEDLQAGLRARYAVPDVVQGVIVTSVDRADLALRPGDVIVEAERTPVGSRAGFDRLIGSARARNAASVTLLVNRADVFSIVALPLTE